MNHSHLCAQMSQSTFLWWRALRFSRFSLFRPRYPTQRQKLPLGGPQLRRLLHVVTDRGRGVHSGDAPSGPDPGHPDRIRACIRAIRTGSGPDPVRAAIRPDPGMLLTDPVRIRGHPDRIRSPSDRQLGVQGNERMRDSGRKQSNDVNVHNGRRPIPKIKK